VRRSEDVGYGENLVMKFWDLFEFGESNATPGSD